MAPAALALSGPVPRWPPGAASCLPRRPPAPNVGGAVPALSKDGGRKCPLLLGSQPSLRAGLGSEMAAAELEYESVLCVKPDVSVYRIPPRTSNRGYRASDWKLDHPDWTGRLRVTSKGKTAYIKLEDKVSGELFAQAPIDQYPGIAVETVTDSSRYFVIRIQDGTGRSAFIGIGFTDRGDAFDFNVSLQDHFKWVKQETEISRESQEADTRPKLDLGFKEGQTIKLNIGNMTTKKGGVAKPRVSGSGGLSLLPPPPGGKIAVPPIPPPSSTAIANQVTPPPVLKSSNASSADILLDLDAPVSASKAPATATADLWGDFSTASSAVPNQAPQQSNWVQF